MKKGFFLKLAAGNIKKNSKTYFPYILTCIVTVAMFYIVKSLSLNPGVEGMAVGGSFMSTTMGLGSFVVALFAFVFLFYTNSFLVKHRKKEFGLFNILGMERRHLALVAGWESVCVMAVSISLGLLLGISLDKVMFLLVMRIIGGEAALGFFISARAVLSTVVFFAGVFLLIALNSIRQIYKAAPVELLRAGNVGEREPKSKWLLAVCGLLAVGGGYYIAITTEDPISSVMMFFVAVLLVILGTYLLFTAGSIVWLKMLRGNKGYYYSTRHFVSVSGMIWRMKQNAVGLANICILSTMVLVMVSTTTAMKAGMEDITANRYPADFMIYDEDGRCDRETMINAIRELQEESGFPVTRQMEYSYLAFQAIREGDGFGVYRDRARSVEDDTNSLFFLTLKDYNAVMGEEKTLREGEIMIYSNRQSYDYPALRLFGREYKVAEKLDGFVGNGEYEALMSGTQYIVVPDMEDMKYLDREQKEILKDLASSIGWVYGFDTDADEAHQQEFANLLSGRLGVTQGERAAGACRLETKMDGRKAFLEIVGGLFFIGVFLGLLFVMATVLIIYYKQISEGYEDKERFEIMQKVGMSRDEVKASIHSQVVTVFFLPLLVAGLHVTAAFPLVSRLLKLVNLYNTALYAACTAGCFLVFGAMYVSVYLLTAKTYYRIVSRQEAYNLT